MRDATRPQAGAKVTVYKMQRNKKKFITLVNGLDAFGVKLPDAAKFFRTRFACGAAVVDMPGKGEEVDIQGDFLAEIAEIIHKKWPDIPLEAIVIDDGKVKTVKKKNK